MPLGGLIAGGIGAIGSGVAGALSSDSQRRQAEAAYQQSVSDLTAIGVPSVEAQKIALQQYQSAGQWNPSLSQTVQQGPSQMGDITTDPNSTAAQQQALSSLQKIGTNGGMLLSDQANLQNTMGQIGAQQKGARDAILQNAAQRGGYGSGMAVAAQLANQQNGAQLANQAGLQTAATAQQRALSAIQGAGQLGGQMQATQFGQKAQQAQAQDAINAWNAQNKQNVYGQNTGTQNQASQYNLGNQQNLMNQNTNLGNQQQLYNSQLQQQNFGNQMGVAQAKANARAGQASNLNQNAQGTSNMFGGIGSAIAQGATAAGQMANTNDQNDKNRKAYGYA